MKFHYQNKFYEKRSYIFSFIQYEVPFGHRPGRRQARHAHILQIGLRLTIAQADARPATALDCLTLHRAMDARFFKSVYKLYAHTQTIQHTKLSSHKQSFEAGPRNRTPLTQQLQTLSRLQCTQNRTTRQNIQLQAVARNIPLEMPVCDIHPALQTQVDSDHIQEVIRITSRQTR